MIKSKQFTDKFEKSNKFFHDDRCIEARDECLKFANKIEENGSTILNISVNYNPGEFVYTIFYREN